jgi:L-ascorbate metabolism protein UlaG (beta-lactamase superfamily)
MIARGVTAAGYHDRASTGAWSAAGTRVLLAIALATMPAPGTIAGDDQVAVTFLANEGFLLEGGGKRVLIDALQGDGLRGYPALTGERRRSLEHGEAPFDRIDLVLASHAHGDHFDPAAVAAFLRRVPGAGFVSTAQAVGRLREQEGFAALAPRVVGFKPQGATRERVEIAGIPVELFGLSHGDTENLGILVTLGGRKLLHVGDTDADAAELAGHRLAAEGIDVALVPYWYFLSEAGRSAVTEQIRARHVVAMHLPTADASPDWFAPAASLDELLGRLGRDAPTVTLFRQPLERKTFPERAPEPAPAPRP